MGFCVLLLTKEKIRTVIFAEIDRNGISMSGRIHVANKICIQRKEKKKKRLRYILSTFCIIYLTYL